MWKTVDVMGPLNLYLILITFYNTAVVKLLSKFVQDSTSLGHN